MTSKKYSFSSALLALTLLMAAVSDAAVFTVTKTNDTDDHVCDADCSYREAIEAASIDTQTSGNDGTVAFAIPGANPHVIDMDPGLPTLSLTPNLAARLIIDGSTQPGFAGDPVVFVNGGGLSDFGFLASGGPTTVRSLGIFGFREMQMSFTSNGNNVIEGCWIGLDEQGTAVASNFGIYFFHSGFNRIGGSSPQQRNVIGGATDGGLIHFDNGSLQNTVFGNYIGVDPSGQNPIFPNPQDAIGVVINDSNLNQIGGPNAGEGNVISGNDTGVLVSGSSVGNVIQGNIIGANAAGTAPLPNQNNGIAVIEAQDTLIGGPNAGEGNLIAYNVGAGISLESNTFDGVVQGNRIVSNGEAGIFTGFGAFQNSFLGNAISANAGLGIDLDNDGVTLNDALDLDSDFQNFPELTVARFDGCGHLKVSGALNSAPDTNDYRLDFFVNDVLDGLQGEGEEFAGAGTANTDALGIATFTSTVDVSGNPVGRFVTATATHPDGGTSEFSTGIPVIESDPGTFNVSVASTTVDESAGNISVALERSCGSTGATSIDVAVTGITATAGEDFEDASQTVTFAEGELEKTILIPVVDDAADEGDETVSILISNPSSDASLGTNSQVTITIVDNDVTQTPDDTPDDGNPSGSAGSGGGCSLMPR